MLDQNKYLGKLCKKGHDHEDTGKSLLYKSSKNCIECVRCREKTPEYKEKARLYGIKNRKRLTIQQRKAKRKSGSGMKFYYRHREDLLLKSKEYRQRPETKLHNRLRARKRRESLNDLYIKNVLINYSNLKTEQITPELIEVKRLQLKIYREIRKLKGGDNNG